MFKKNYFFKILLTIFCVIITAATTHLLIKAGDLNPPGTPADTMHTLDDIYHRLDKDAGAPASWTLNPSASPAGTMHSLEDIYTITPDFRTNAGTAVVGDVCNSHTFYATSSSIQTGNRTACFNHSLVDTGQSTSTTATFGEDHDYTSANSAATCDMSYTDNGNGTITDNCTGLMWKKCSEPDTSTTTCAGTHSTYTWENALARCEGLTYPADSYTDWRLPNIKELHSIVNFNNYNPSISTSTFPTTVASSYWSGTTYVYNPSNAWYVSFFYGNTGSYYKTGNSYVRCVRG